MKQIASTTSTSYPSTAFGSATWRYSRYQIADAFASCFSAAEFPHYEAFMNVLGQSLKREQRTLVTIIQRPYQGSPVEGVSSFVLKVYKYPFLPRIRTGFQISKAEREFQSLRYLNEMGIGGAQAVGYGVERDLLGLVRSCFIITQLVDDSINLSQWYPELGSQEKLDARRVDQVFTQLGRMFRRLHEARFFLFTAKSKNILLRRDVHRADELFFIDIPYARTLKWRLLARWAQARDIGVLLGNVTAPLSNMAIESFYQGYLPDPLGMPAKTVKRHALRQMRVKQNRTLISRWVNNIKRPLIGKASRVIRFLILAEITYG
jgi:tRNA A-37 threonylcarbamoyl transferase component Bud32